MERKSYQTRALLRKSVTLQLRQKGTNCCQILTPILCLLLVFLMKTIAETQIEENVVKPAQLESIPRFLNPPFLPNYILYNLIGLDVDSCEQWYLYETSSGDIDEFVGNLTGEYFEIDDTVTRSGLLGEIPNSFCRSNVMRNPYFERPKSTINIDIYSAIEAINSSPLRRQQTPFLDQLPDGAVTFYEANSTQLSYKAQINDHKFSSYHRKNGITKIGIRAGNASADIMTVTDGMLTLIDMVNQAFFNKLFKNDTQIVSLVQYMPIQIQEMQELYRLLNILGASLYPIALSLLLPVFMYAIVLEKEEKLQDFMRMNGMSMWSYWLVNFLFDYFLFLITVLIFFTFGVLVIQLQFFTETSGWVMASFILGWGVSQISMAFFIQVFISKARTATIWGYLLSIWTVLWGITLNLAVYPMPDPMPYYLLLYPHFAMTRGIYILSYNCGYWKCIESFSEVSGELSFCIASLWLMGIAILLVSIYLNEIVPREFGVSKHPLFCFKKEETYDMSPLLPSGDEEPAVKEEREKVYTMVPPYSYPLVVKDISKKFGSKKAVNNLCLTVQENELFGLLGPNGAGKTTLISMLTGLHRPDSGNAWISGASIVNDLDNAQLYIGVCPQFDILWPELSVEEHLLFYARLKGIDPANEQTRLNAALEGVMLTPFKNLKSTELSGGMRRRLSVAIALVGNPRIIFLDEPTTGLDPENRRQLWEILERCKEGRAMVLTTHSMEEADVLCSRVAIINHGVLKCIGPQTSLKSLYGGGFHLFINVRKPDTVFEDSQDDLITNTREYVHEKLPTAALISEFNGNLVYQVPQCRVSSVFEIFERDKDSIGISDWGISQSSLEDVFLKVIDEY